MQKQESFGSPFTSSAGSALGYLLRNCVRSEYAGSVTYHSHLGSSDHIGLFVKFNLDLQVPPPLVSQRVYHWPLELYSWSFSSCLVVSETI